MNKFSATARFALASLIISLLFAATSIAASSSRKVIQTEALTLTGNRSVNEERKSLFLPYKSAEKVIATKPLTFSGKRKQQP